jgi:flagellar biosynthesis/type III secretory pathway protein FliH
VNTTLTPNECLLRERQIKRQRELDEFKDKLARTHGLERDAKFEKAFALAWEYGHSSGYHEVENYFSDLVELIK